MYFVVLTTSTSGKAGSVLAAFNTCQWNMQTGE